jgi:Immunity protein 35
MIDIEQAKTIAEEYVNRGYCVEGDRLVVVDRETIEKEYGWIFFYDSLRYLESGDDSYLIAGNAPLIVEKDDGSVHVLPAVPSLEQWIAQYEAQRAR